VAAEAREGLEVSFVVVVDRSVMRRLRSRAKAGSPVLGKGSVRIALMVARPNPVTAIQERLTVYST
jgi:hypothetical protein